MSSDPRHEPVSQDFARSPLWSGALLLAWILLVTGLGALSGVLFPPGDWFASLAKPTFQPPNWLFGPVWTVLYVAMAVAAWVVQRTAGVDSGLRRRAFVLFFVQFALNLAWTPLFFGLRSPGVAFVDICALWIVLLWTLLAFGRVRPLAGYLLLPYLLWVSFALVLNGTIWLMNV
jgi:benzodiazapine receptor